MVWKWPYLPLLTVMPLLGRSAVVTAGTFSVEHASQSHVVQPHCIALKEVCILMYILNHSHASGGTLVHVAYAWLETDWKDKIKTMLFEDGINHSRKSFRRELITCVCMSCRKRKFSSKVWWGRWQLCTPLLKERTHQYTIMHHKCTLVCFAACKCQRDLLPLPAE